MSPSEAIILAAGVGSRLRERIGHQPKCLSQVGGTSIIAHQVAALRSVGVDRVVVVTGFRAELVKAAVDAVAPDMERLYVHNARYAETNVLTSWWLGSEHLTGDHYYMHADTVFEVAFLERLAQSEPDHIVLAVDRHDCAEEEMKVRLLGDDVIEISKEMNPGTAAGEFTGILRAPASLLTELREVADGLLSEAAGEALFFEATLGVLIRDAVTPVRWLDVTGLRWREIDFPEDLDAANALFDGRGLVG